MSNQQPLLGFLFSCVSVVMWGALPLAVQQVIQGMDAQTLVWYRFVIAGIGLLLILGPSRKLPKLSKIPRGYIWLILIGSCALCANFFLFNLALEHIPPTTSQIFGPFSSFLMLLAGVFIFKEVIGVHQKIGFLIVVCGLLLFFNDRLLAFQQFDDYMWGILLAMSASLIWNAYGIPQKILLKRLSSQQILIIVYVICALIMTPTSTPTQALELNFFQLCCFIFCCLNTLIAYGCYAEALNRWEVAKVSVMMTQIPVCSLLLSLICHSLYPQIFPAVTYNSITYIGALVVVCGAMLSTVGHKLFKPKGKKTF